MSLIQAYNKERLMMRTIGRASQNGIDFMPYRSEYKALQQKHLQLGDARYASELLSFCNKVFDELSMYNSSDDINFETAIAELIGHFALNGKDAKIPMICGSRVENMYMMQISYHGMHVIAYRPFNQSHIALSYGWSAFRTEKEQSIKTSEQLVQLRIHAIEQYYVDCNIADLKHILTNL